MHFGTLGTLKKRHTVQESQRGGVVFSPIQGLWMFWAPRLPPSSARLSDCWLYLIGPLRSAHRSASDAWLVHDRRRGSKANWRSCKGARPGMVSDSCDVNCSTETGITWFFAVFLRTKLNCSALLHVPLPARGLGIVARSGEIYWESVLCGVGFPISRPKKKKKRRLQIC